MSSSELVDVVDDLAALVADEAVVLELAWAVPSLLLVVRTAAILRRARHRSITCRLRRTRGPGRCAGAAARGQSSASPTRGPMTPIAS